MTIACLRDVDLGGSESHRPADTRGRNDLGSLVSPAKSPTQSKDLQHTEVVCKCDQGRMPRQ